MRKAIVAALLIGFIATSAHAYKFKASWEPPADGPRPDSYRLYVCDQPVTSGFGGTVSDVDLVGKCKGNLQTWTATGTEIESDYMTEAKSLTLFFRVTSMIRHEAGGDDGMLESDLSEQATHEFTTVEVQLPKPPGAPTVQGPKVIVVMP